MISASPDLNQACLFFAGIEKTGKIVVLKQKRNLFLDLAGQFTITFLHFTIHHYITFSLVIYLSLCARLPQIRRGAHGCDSENQREAIMEISDLDCVTNFRIRSVSGPHFPAIRLNTEIQGVSLHIQSECGKIRTRKTPNTDTFQTQQDKMQLLEIFFIDRADL